VLFSKTAATGHFGDTHYENCSSRGGGTLAEYSTRQSVYFAFLVLGVVLGHHGDLVAGR
jgi:hypothetical protein